MAIKNWVNTVILSVVRDCNLRCKYCQTGPYLRENTNCSLMPLELVEKIISETLQLVENNKSFNSIEFHFSGGEPLLAGIKYFQNCLRLQNKYKKNGVEIENSVQTNGTLINDGWAKFFKENNFGVSISIDGPEQIQNVQRPMLDGTGSYCHVKNNLKLLDSYNVPFGLIGVVTKNSVLFVEPIVKFMLSCNPQNVVFLPCADNSPIFNKDWQEFLTKAFDLWIDHQINKNSIPIRIFRDVCLFLCGISPVNRACDFSKKCLHPNISPDGIVSVCDQFVGKEVGVLGDLKKTSLASILNSSMSQDFSCRYESLPESCEDCLYVELCNGGCAYRRYLNNGVDYLCESRKNIFKYIDSKIDSLLIKESDKPKVNLSDINK